jgi:transposase
VPRRQFYCSECQRYSTEHLTWIDWQRRHTQRYEANIFEQVINSGIEKVAQLEDLSFDEIEGIFNHVSSQRVKKNWEPVRRLSLDEIAMRKGHKNFKTVVSDIDRGKLISVINGHSQEVIIAALIEQPIEVRACVEEVSIDMWGGFNRVIALVFPNAKIVTDRFHVMKPLIKELNTIAIQVGIKGFDKRRILLGNRENLTESQLTELKNLLSRSSRLRQAYEFKEEFREIYETSQSVEEGKQRFKDWLKEAQEVYGQVLTTIRTHLDSICNYFLSHSSSGVMEGINNKIKQIKRQAYGFTNFENFRVRLLACFAD